jgi:hypothetical protein
MDEEEEDLDIAAAMGFASFGGAKKRKYDQTSSPKAKVAASGANTAQLGVRSKKTVNEELSDGHVDDVSESTLKSVPAAHQPKKAQKPPAASGLADFLARAQTLPEKPPDMPETGSTPVDPGPSATEMVSFGGPAISKAELNALRFGVRNEHGDTAYFLPNFVEDPWVNIKRGT